MFRWKTAGICLGLLSLLLAGCAEPENTGDEDRNAMPAASYSPEPANGAGTRPEKLSAADPEATKLLLAEEALTNGDIYLENDQVHINIVGLNSEVEELFAGSFSPGSYTLHDVKFSAGELEAAQKLLAERNLHNQLNLYGSWIDVKQNKLAISVPDDYLKTAEQTLEQLVDPGMLRFEAQKLGEPGVTGTIVEFKSGTSDSILILEPGQEDPTYWFSFNGRSELYDAAGQAIDVSDLKRGHQVLIWGTGTVNDSLPAQATVRRIQLME